MGQTHRRGSEGTLAQVLAGVLLISEAFSLVRGTAALRRPAGIPILFSLLTIAIVFGLVYENCDQIYGWIDGFFPLLEVKAGYQWIWLGPARLFFWLLTLLLFALFVALALLAGLLLANIAASPFLDVLSARVEALESGDVVATEEEGTKAWILDWARIMKAEIQRVGLFLLLGSVLFVSGFLIPGAQVIVGPLAILLTIVFLPLEYCAYTLDRRQVPFRARGRWLKTERPRALGFGVGAFCACLLPGVNLLAMPVLVTAGTLLVVRFPPAGGFGGGASGPSAGILRLGLMRSAPKTSPTLLRPPFVPGHDHVARSNAWR